MKRLGEAWQGFKVGTWLGWQIESNWTEPFLFAIYSVIKPVAGVLILVFMYLIAAQGGLTNPLFPQVFLGTTLYLYVLNVLSGISWAVLDDREHRRAGPSYTADTLAEFAAEFPGESLVLMMGIDAFNGLPGWHEVERILDLAHIAVATSPTTGSRSPT